MPARSGLLQTSTQKQCEQKLETAPISCSDYCTEDIYAIRTAISPNVLVNLQELHVEKGTNNNEAAITSDSIAESESQLRNLALNSFSYSLL